MVSCDRTFVLDELVTKTGHVLAAREENRHLFFQCDILILYPVIQCINCIIQGKHSTFSLHVKH